MVCAYCGIERKWPDDFPSRIYAECRSCYRDRQKKKHWRKGWYKRAKRKFVKKRAWKWGIMESNKASPVFTLEIIRGEGCKYGYAEKEIRYQTFQYLISRGFDKGFWEARQLGKEKPKVWVFYWMKKYSFDWLKEGQL